MRKKTPSLKSWTHNQKQEALKKLALKRHHPNSKVLRGVLEMHKHRAKIKRISGFEI